MSAPTFYRDARGALRLRGAWPACIEVAGSLLALAAEGGTVGVSVTGHGMSAAFDSVTFICEDSEATYDLRPQDDDDVAHDTYRGVRRGF